MILQLILYDILFFGIYTVMSTSMCIHQGYHITSKRLIREIKEGCKGMLTSLSLSNIASLIVMPYTNVENTQFGWIPCLQYFFVFDMFLFFSHWIIHQFPFLYRTIHKHHHSTVYVAPFTSLVLDFKEHIVTGLIPTNLSLFFIDISLSGWILVNTLIFLHGIAIHSTYRLPYEGKWFLGSYSHASHHIHMNSHYGFLNPLWDVLFDTSPYTISSRDINNRIMKHYNTP